MALTGAPGTARRPALRLTYPYYADGFGGLNVPLWEASVFPDEIAQGVVRGW
jgi:hypothetical protein